MLYLFSRRSFLRFAATLPALAISSRASAQSPDDAETKLANLEKSSGLRLGVFALDTATGREVRHRADERFPLLSTFKLIAVAAVLKRSESEPGLLNQRIRYNKSNLVTYSPITEKHLASGMTVAELCAAALQYSDNTAGNLLIRLIGSPLGVTEFAQKTGNNAFRLDRWETRLNIAIPGDQRDTATPESMARSLRAFALGNALSPLTKAQLVEWLRGNTTGDKRIRAAVPESWIVGDKTGSGDYGAANDIALIWPPNRAPIVLAIYTTHNQADAKRSDEAIVETTRIVLNGLGVRQLG